MGSTRKGMLNVLIAAVLWGSSGVCAQYIMEQSRMSSQFLTMIRLLFAGLILVTFSFMHGDKIFSILKNRKDALSLLIFSVVGALTVQLTFLLTIEKSNAATATVLQFLSPTIIVAWFALARRNTTRHPGLNRHSYIAYRHLFTGDSRQSNIAVDLFRRAVLGYRLRICRRLLYDLAFQANRPIRHAASGRLEYVLWRPYSAALLR